MLLQLKRISKWSPYDTATTLSQKWHIEVWFDRNMYKYQIKCSVFRWRKGCWFLERNEIFVRSKACDMQPTVATIQKHRITVIKSSHISFRNCNYGIHFIRMSKLLETWDCREYLFSAYIGRHNSFFIFKEPFCSITLLFWSLRQTRKNLLALLSMTQWH